MGGCCWRRRIFLEHKGSVSLTSTDGHWNAGESKAETLSLAVDGRSSVIRGHTNLFNLSLSVLLKQDSEKSLSHNLALPKTYFNFSGGTFHFNAENHVLLENTIK
ncbi:hypothetical protein AVEN_29454-1 [Araneus ventricosus]|uniref:Uncharacterized protein n=1 Tax=Araneus ventricosus TaxID=182803 RepID=A0A4Y2KDG3_ARAVE|nr:hypothetical protein AVEN_29454-1 [Araneus ventricosus]